MNLPKEIWTIIFLECRIIDLLRLQLVCKTFNQITVSKYFRDNYTTITAHCYDLLDYFDRCDDDYEEGDVILINDNLARSYQSFNLIENDFIKRWPLHILKKTKHIEIKDMIWLTELETRELFPN